MLKMVFVSNKKLYLKTVINGSHLTSVFASMSLSKFNIASMVTQMQKQRRGRNSFCASMFALLLTQCKTLTMMQTETSSINTPSMFVLFSFVQLRMPVFRAVTGAWTQMEELNRREQSKNEHSLLFLNDNEFYHAKCNLN